MTPFGMSMEILEGAKVGSAAAVKMCRSIVVKGIEALLFECVMAATKFGADDLVFASLKETWPGIDWKKLADYTSGRVVVHGERRAREMEEVAETLKAIGIDPIMAEATARRQDWSAADGSEVALRPGRAEDVSGRRRRDREADHDLISSRLAFSQRDRRPASRPALCGAVSPSRGASRPE